MDDRSEEKQNKELISQRDSLINFLELKVKPTPENSFTHDFEKDTDCYEAQELIKKYKP